MGRVLREEVEESRAQQAEARNLLEASRAPQAEAVHRQQVTSLQLEEAVHALGESREQQVTSLSPSTPAYSGLCKGYVTAEQGVIECRVQRPRSESRCEDPRPHAWSMCASCLSPAFPCHVQPHYIGVPHPVTYP